MAPRSRSLALAAMLVLVAPTMLAAGPSLAGPLADAHSIPVPVLSLDLHVAAMFSGFVLSAAEKEALADAVTDEWTPVVVASGLPIGVHYNVTLRFIETTSAFETALADEISASFANDTLDRVVGNYPGLFENLTAAFPSVQQTTPVPHADADAVLEWIAAADGAFPEVLAGPDEARLFFLNPVDVAAPYYYRVDSADRDTGSQLTFETANAWGGLDGIFFQDLRAAPNHLGEGSGVGRPANFVGQPPLWSYGATPTERSRLVADLAHYIDASVRILGAPAYAVTPFYPSDLKFDVTLYDGTPDQTAFVPGGVGAAHGINGTEDILDPVAFRAAVADLLPLAPVTVELALASRTSDPDIASAVSSHLTLGPAGAQLLDPFGINSALETRFDVPSTPIVPGQSVTIPVLVAVLDDEVYVQGVGTRGATLQRSDGRAASIIIAVGLEQLEARGLTDTLIHEGGHALGLSHPHEVAPPGATSNMDLLVDWIRDLTSTPMTYLPNYVDYTFDSFDKRAVLSGVSATTLAAAYLARQEAYNALDNRGYGSTTLPSSIQTKESLFQSYALQTAGAMATGGFYVPAGVTSPESGAAVAAKRAFDQAQAMLIDAVLQPTCCTSDGPPAFLPGPGALTGVVALAAVAVALCATRARRPGQ